jgi:hypothetical protein
MDITVRVTTRCTTGPEATRAEVRDQLVEEIASISQFAVEHTAEDGTTSWADCTIETVRAVEDGS